MTIHGVLCGINYNGTENQLNGCINDMLDMQSLLLKSGAQAKNITLLSDDPKRKDIFPTKENILGALSKKTKELKAGDTLVVHYSGHGTYSRDTSGDEADKRDEAICAITKRGQIVTITDDELNSLLRKLNKGVKVFVLMDCCHSASILDLKENLDKNESNRPVDNNHDFIAMISGCQDDQTSADAEFDKSANKREFAFKLLGKEKGVRYGGALTASFMDAVEKRKGLKAVLDVCFSGSKDLMRKLRDDMLAWLKSNGFTQKPNIAFEGRLPVTARSLPVLDASSAQTSFHWSLLMGAIAAAASIASGAGLLAIVGFTLGSILVTSAISNWQRNNATKSFESFNSLEKLHVVENGSELQSLKSGLNYGNLISFDAFRHQNVLNEAKKLAMDTNESLREISKLRIK